MIDQATIEEFKLNLRGQLILPGDEDYDEACKIYNAMIERRPGLIARCADVGDVMAAVNFARENDVLVAIRGGGHNGPGLGTCDDGLVIDMSAIKYTRVDPQRVPYKLEGVAHRVMWTMQLMPSVWPSPPESSQLLGWAD